MKNSYSYKKKFKKIKTHQDTDQDGFDDAVEKGYEKKEKAVKEKKPWNPTNYLIWLLSRREHSRAELKTKLIFKLKEKDLIGKHDPDKLLDHLAELNLQSDQRFLESHVRMAASSGRGPGWVKNKLYHHQLNQEKLSEAINEIDESYWEKEAYSLAFRRYGVGPYPFDKRMKIGNFLIRRGYSVDIARKITANEWPEEYKY